MRVDFDPNKHWGKKTARVVLGSGTARAEFTGSCGGNTTGYDTMESCIQDAWERIEHDEDFEDVRDVTFTEEDGSTLLHEAMTEDEFKDLVVCVEYIAFEPEEEMD